MSYTCRECKGICNSNTYPSPVISIPSNRVDDLQNKLMAVRNYQIAGKTQSVTTRTTVKGEQIRVERRVQLHTERRIVDPKIYGFLSECSSWVQSKSVSCLSGILLESCIFILFVFFILMT